uniref:Uncharacterized protein n=1 Tax=Tanacetum cinerariifolium TaxID=118510 RepID=A0A6L2MQP9_TANCI|nr:hypothetical protein [Tanacetum cinerariifolium]
MIIEMLRSRFLNDGEGDSGKFMLLGKQLWGENGAIQTRKRQRELDGHLLEMRKNRMLILLAMVLGILVINQANRLGLSPPPELATFWLTAEEKKRKRTELNKEVFVTENVRVDRMDRNLIPPPRIMPIQGLVTNEPESGIFFMNMNTNIGFQWESEFHLTNQGRLRDCYGDVLKDELCNRS